MRNEDLYIADSWEEELEASVKIMKNENLKNFLEELSELSNKYGFEIGGCGCCGSPWVVSTDGELWINELEFKNGKYKVCADNGIEIQI